MHQRKIQEAWEEVEGKSKSLKSLSFSQCHRDKPFSCAIAVWMEMTPFWLTPLSLGWTEIAVDARCRVGGSDTKRGRVAFVGEVAEIPGVGPWVGVTLDEPVGKNDGSVGDKRYFSCNPSCGVFVRPEKVEVGGFPPIGMDEDLGSDMEEM